MFSVELVPDAAIEAAVRADWDRLRRADLPNSGRNPSPSNRPHVTLAVRDELTVEAIQPNVLAVGTGYGLDADWRHGMYQGPDTVVQGITYNVDDIAQLGAYAVVDQSSRVSYDGHSGYGLYEHAFSGKMPKYGLD